MSVYKDKKRGTFYVSYSIKDPLTNKYIHKTKRGFESSREAKEWERENRIRTKSQTTVTFRDIAKIWEDHLQSSAISRRHHREHFEYRFKAYLDKPISNITKADLLEWKNWLSESQYATKTKNQAISYVKGVFRFANEIYDIPNPSTILTGFKKTEDEWMHEMDIWSPEEFNRFIEYVDDQEYKTFFEFMFWTGVRRGEAIALQKVDVSNKTAVIKYSQRAAVNGLHPTKTRQRRQISIDDQLWLHLQPLLKTDGNYVFGGYVGLAPTTIDRIFKKAIRDSGVKNIRLHDLRHSHASWLINSGVNIVAVSKRLGHTNIEQTLRTYTHLLEFTDQNMIQKLNEFRKCETNHETKYKIIMSSDTNIELNNTLKTSIIDNKHVYGSSPISRPDSKKKPK